MVFLLYVPTLQILLLQFLFFKQLTIKHRLYLITALKYLTDLKNGVKQIINYITDPNLGIIPQLMVTGADAGVQNSFTISSDKFASSDPRMINFKNYYYMAVSYAYNNFLPYNQSVTPTAAI